MKKKHIVSYVPGTRPPPTKTNVARLKALTDEEIVAAVRSDPDTELLDAKFWANAKLEIPEPKVAVSLRLDREVLDAFKAEGPGYQTRINAVLRNYVEHKPKKRA